MLVVGLTGGIGSGKSIVADLFAKLKTPVIDTDILARELVKPGSAALTAIEEHFGSGMINADGTLNRQALRYEIFEAPSERLWLEQLLHPQIRALAKKQINEIDSPYCILVVPLLVENLPNPLVNRILVVDCPEELQIARVQERDNVTDSQVHAIIESQASREERLAAADDVILNDRDLTHLQTEVQKLHQKYTAFE